MRTAGDAERDDLPPFLWAVGEEMSDPVTVRGGERVRVDQAALSGHLDRLDADLADVASLGVDAWRYGMPWRLTEPRPGEYDWSLWDRALERAAAWGLEPVVDFVHFGLPEHLGGFCDRAWVDALCRYVDAFLARYPAPRWFTPVNEPGFTAFSSAVLGIWNDRRSSDEDFAHALAHCVLAELEVHQRVVADRDGWWLGADAVTCPLVDDGADDEGRDLARRLDAYGRTIWALRLGAPQDPSLAPAFATVDDATMARIASLRTTYHYVAGHDFYPQSVVVIGRDVADVSLDDRIDTYRRWAERWHGEFRVPFWVSETSNAGLDVGEQVPWLDGMCNAVEGMARDGLPVRGLCWYSRGDQHDWESMFTETLGQVLEVGLFDQARRPRPVVDRWRALSGGARDPRRGA